MAAITSDLVDDVWQELLASPPAAISTAVDGFRRAQPELAGCVRAMEGGFPDDRFSGELILYAVWAHEVCRRAGRARREITGDMIEAALGENERLLAAVEAAPPGDVMSTAAEWTESYPHLPLLGAILNQAMAGDLEETRRVDDVLGMFTLHMKTIVDCLASD